MRALNLFRFSEGVLVMESNQKESLSLKLINRGLMILTGLFALAIPSLMHAHFKTIENTPFIKIKAEITQKQGNDIYLRSSELPMGGATISVQDSVAGRLKESEFVCIQYKNIQAGFAVESEPQYGVEVCEQN
jgi:hypothetical protein